MTAPEVLIYNYAHGCLAGFFFLLPLLLLLLLLLLSDRARITDSRYARCEMRDVRYERVLGGGSREQEWKPYLSFVCIRRWGCVDKGSIREERMLSNCQIRHRRMGLLARLIVFAIDKESIDENSLQRIMAIVAHGYIIIALCLGTIPAMWRQ